MKKIISVYLQFCVSEKKFSLEICEMGRKEKHRDRIWAEFWEVMS